MRSVSNLAWGNTRIVVSDYQCKLQWDEGNNNRSISWGFGDMLSRWLAQSDAFMYGEKT